MSDTTFTGRDAAGSTITFRGQVYSSVKYPGGVLYYDNSGSPVLVGLTNPMPVSVINPIPAGSNNIGLVDISASLPAGTNNIGDVDIATMPGSAATTDTVAVKHSVDAMHSDVTALTPLRTKISGATSGNNTVVAAVADKQILVLAYTLVAVTAVNAKFQDGASGTDITGLMTMATGIPISAPFCPVGHMICSTNTLLNLSLSGTVQVSGHITYVTV